MGCTQDVIATAPLGTCDGCDDAPAESVHDLTYHDGTHGSAAYCAECRLLARADHSNTIAAVDGVPTREAVPAT